MKIKKGTILKINHVRKGTFFGMADEDFDTEKEEFYPIKVAQLKPIKGLVNEWEVGERIPCRAGFCEVEMMNPSSLKDI